MKKIENLTEHPLGKDRPARWVVNDKGPFGIFQVFLQDKRRFGWRSLGSSYPELFRESAYDTTPFEDLIEEAKDFILYRLKADARREQEVINYFQEDAR